MAAPVSAGNKVIVCQYKDYISSYGVWHRNNPLHYSTPLLLLQLSAVSLTSMLFDVCLQPLGQSSMVSQILGGVIVGPSFLGHNAIMGNALFPSRSILNLETFATFGIVFFLLAIGIKTNPIKNFHPGKEAAIVGVASMMTTFILTVVLACVLKSYVSMDATLASSLPFIAAAQSMTAFPNIACVLGELNMASSDIGQLAASSSMFCDVIGLFIVTFSYGIINAREDPTKSIFSILTICVYIGLMHVCVPLVHKLVKRIPSDKPLEEPYVFICFTCTLVSSLLTEVLGQHFIFGPLILGLMLPEGPPLGAAIISKLDYPVGKILYPTFLTASGLKTNIFEISSKSLWIVVVIVIFSCTTKFITIVFTSRFLNIQFKDSVMLGLLLNARGSCEIIMFNIMRNQKVLYDQEFTLCILVSVLGVTAIVTPLLRFLCDPFEAKVPFKRQTIQHSKHNLELRILVCIKDQDNVPSMINLLEASHATEESPIAVIAVVLEELVGRATPMLVAHQSTQTLKPNNSKSGHIVNALHQYELSNKRCVTLQSFNSISHIQTMHYDICRVALDQNATILILPFHKRWEIDGKLKWVSRPTQSMNIKVMERCPCTVGILVDRGVLTCSLSVLNNQSIYKVAVIYIGGPDDAESLCYGARMGKHNNVSLTVLRILFIGCDNARDRKNDNILIDEVRRANIGNENFVYQEHIVKDGIGLVASLTALEGNYELMIVGRQHPPSPILKGLGVWSECPELGEVGDMLASSDTRSTCSILVVQQQRLKVEKFNNRRVIPMVIRHESIYDENEDRLEISIGKDRN